MWNSLRLWIQDFAILNCSFQNLITFFTGSSTVDGAYNAKLENKNRDLKTSSSYREWDFEISLVRIKDFKEQRKKFELPSRLSFSVFKQKSSDKSFKSQFR